MKSIELFGKQIPIRTRDCQIFNNPIRQFGDGKTVNLFIQVESACNARCKFCEYHSNKSEKFDFLKLSDILDELMSKATLGKINITGGEPTLHHDKYLELVSLIHTKAQLMQHKPYITVNTNGFNIESLEQSLDKVDQVALSRHHFNDSKNIEVFGTAKVPQENDIRNIVSKLEVSNRHKLNLRCNLIKGYIDTTDKIISYLNWCESLGVVWVEFVTLMPLNDFCIANEVMCDKLFEHKGFTLTEDWKRWEPDSSGVDKVVCRCNDHIYIAKNGAMIRFYNRIFNNCNLNDGQLVYDGQNLRLGFSGDIIY